MVLLFDERIFEMTAQQSTTKVDKSEIRELAAAIKKGANHER